MAGTPTPAGPLIFSTRTLTPTRRRPALCALREQGVLPIEPLPHSAALVDLVKWRLPGAWIMAGTFAGVQQGGAADDLFFGINVVGSSTAQCRGHQVTVAPGDAVAIDPDAPAFGVLRPTPARLIGLRLPRAGVPLDRTSFAKTPLRLVPACNPTLQLLTDYLRIALRSDLLTTAPTAQSIVSHCTDLIALTLAGASQTASETAVRAARLTALKADIDRQLTDPALCAAAVAARQGISARYLHRLFAAESTTYSRYVLDRRLTLAMRLLRLPASNDRTISAIAHHVGFGDLSYFNRTFRRRYGITPTDARAITQLPS